MAKRNLAKEHRQSMVTEAPRLKARQAALGVTRMWPNHPATPRSASCPNLGEACVNLKEQPLEKLLKTKSATNCYEQQQQRNQFNRPLPKFLCSTSCAPPPASVPQYFSNNLRAAEGSTAAAPDLLRGMVTCGACPCGPCPCGPCCGGCCPVPGSSCGGCALPPPCNTPPKCIQYMTGYYYYPYGFWFCGPYHVSGTCVPGGPVRPGPCGPCGPAPPCPGGPCGPCCIGPCGSCCMVSDIASLLPESQYKSSLASKVSEPPKVDDLVSPMSLLATLLKHGPKGIKLENFSKNAKDTNMKKSFNVNFDAAENTKASLKEVTNDLKITEPSAKGEENSAIPKSDAVGEESRIIATLAVVDPITPTTTTLGCPPCGVGPVPCGCCGCPWPGGCAPCGCGGCCGPCGCGGCCGPCGCGPCGPCGCGPCGPCGCGPCGPCGVCNLGCGNCCGFFCGCNSSGCGCFPVGCGPCCGPCCGCGPCGPCGGCCSPFPCGPCCCGLFCGPCMNCQYPQPVYIPSPVKPGGPCGPEANSPLPKLCVFQNAASDKLCTKKDSKDPDSVCFCFNCRSARSSPPVDQPEQYFYPGNCPTCLTPRSLPQTPPCRYVINPNMAKYYPFNQQPCPYHNVRYFTTGNADQKSQDYEKASILPAVKSEPVKESRRAYDWCLPEHTSCNDVQDCIITEECDQMKCGDIGGMKFKKLKPTFYSETIVVRKVGVHSGHSSLKKLDT